MDSHRLYRIALRTLGGVLLAAAAMMVLDAATAQQVSNLTNEDVAQIEAGPQPIKFSHQIHAGQNQIDCEYCHVYARRSKTAGIPPVAVCMGCHNVVGQQLSEVQKVVEYWEAQEPIPWVRIHDVADFVRFPHDQHVTAQNELYPDGVPCQDCHGQVENMEVVQVADPNFGNMGWCLDCHLQVPGAMERKRAVPAEPGSMKVANATNPHGDYARPLITDCFTCHY